MTNARKDFTTSVDVTEAGCVTSPVSVTEGAWRKQLVHSKFHADAISRTPFEPWNDVSCWEFNIFWYPNSQPNMRSY